MAARRVVMVPPAYFRFNEQTSDNAFQNSLEEDISAKVMAEFDAMAAQLKAFGVEITLLEPPEDAPDAVFPNNWFSYHSDATLVLYPMKAPNRRPERQPESLLSILRPSRVIDLSPYEAKGKFLEGTGSLVFDHENLRVYASLSERTNRRLVELVPAELGYEPICFESTFDGKPVYHTNVMMSVAGDFIVVCLESVTKNRAELQASLNKSGKRIIEISPHQMKNFCGNILELESIHGEKLLLMSTTAQKAFGQTEFPNHNIIAVEIPTIEKVSGGSARCMVAEVPI